ncbi:seminase [Drosophila rhopaloa]|uniref:Brain-specific serine protease 4 n=1 Tax=Drosophila rhopaloa TaxID=1041015 RepID=A0A6P4EY17_DRORH|nr:seminase [Drosophila rhopaloa]
MSSRWVIITSLFLLISSNKSDEVDEEPAPRIHPRIYGGRETSNSEIGGVGVQIFYKTKLLCSGTLITSRHFLASAHCFENMNLNKFHVIAGHTREFNRHDTNAQNYILQLRLHPEYNKEKFIADIAVGKSTYPLEGKYIGYAKICRTRLHPEDKVTVAGFGSSDSFLSAGSRKTLRSMKVGIVDRHVCQKQLRIFIPSNVLCARAYNHETVCTGDSGGPLMFQNEVCGLSTWTYKCGNSRKPDIYMSVRYYAKFINKTINAMGF